ncbi:acyltransferase family protein [Hyphobacterium sp.]|uniref:acyltransferase family protein n=1 Tax=Hyphobacterium sp. TaxID=2004662 RepID=UPI003749960C
MGVSNWTGFLFAGRHGRLEDRANNFTAIRTAFAFLVLAGHAIMLPIGLPIYGEFAVFVDNSVQFALDGFFILSGYMIAASLMRSRDLTQFALARMFRIFPGLIAAMLILWLAVGPLFTALPLTEYWSQSQTLLFPFLIVGQGDPQASLPGVFATHPLTEMNGPLWTIRFELLAYLGAGIMAAIGLFRNKWGVLALFAGAALLSDVEMAWPYAGIGDDTLFYGARFGGAFLTGAVLYAWRDHIPLAPGWAVMLIAAAFLLRETPASMISGQIAMAYATLWAGYLMIPGKAGKAIREVEDISYGVYILHWPIGQMTLALFPGAGAAFLFAVMVPTATIGGWLMRVAFEKPALAWKYRLRRKARAYTAIPAG